MNLYWYKVDPDFFSLRDVKSDYVRRAYVMKRLNGGWTASVHRKLNRPSVTVATIEEAKAWCEAVVQLQGETS